MGYNARNDEISDCVTRIRHIASTIALDQIGAIAGQKSQTIGRLQHSRRVKFL
jgi:hypothetical protein